MTQQLQRGGRQLIDQLLADLADLEGGDQDLDAAEAILADLPLALIKFNPQLVDDRLTELRQLLILHRQQNRAALEAMRRRIKGDLEKMLERNRRNAEGANLAERVAELERRLADLEDRPPKVTPLRQSGS